MAGAQITLDKFLEIGWRMAANVNAKKKTAHKTKGGIIQTLSTETRPLYIMCLSFVLQSAWWHVWLNSPRSNWVFFIFASLSSLLMLSSFLGKFPFAHSFKHPVSSWRIYLLLLSMSETPWRHTFNNNSRLISIFIHSTHLHRKSVLMRISLHFNVACKKICISYIIYISCK